MISYTNIICMRIPWTYDSQTSFWLLSIVARLVPIVNRSATRLLEEIKPPFLPVTDIIPEEKKVEVIAKDTSATINIPTANSNPINWVRVWSVVNILEVAQKLTDAIALLRAEQYSKVSHHIEMYIADISTLDPQYALVSLHQLKERLDIFAKQNIQEGIQATTTLYSPPSDEVYSWFRESPYKTKQSECIKELNVRSQVQVLTGQASSMISALSEIAESSTNVQQALKEFKKWKDAISSSVSMEKIYKDYFGTLDSNIVWVLYQWDIIDTRLHPMLAQHFARKKQAPKISETLKELFYMNLIHRRRTPNIDLSK